MSDRSRSFFVVAAVNCLAFVLGNAWACVCPAQTPDKPWLVTLDEQDSPERKAIEQEIIVEFDCADLLSKHQMRALTDKPFYVFENDIGFQSQSGIARFMTPSGESIQARFWTVSNPAVFHGFVGKLMKMRGSAAEVTGDTFRKRISVPPPPAEPGKRQVVWNDAYVSYHDGIVILGESDALLTIALDSLRSIVSQAKQATTYFWFSPEQLPLNWRQQFVVAFRSATGVLSQRGDSEGVEQYLARRTRGETFLLLAEQLLFEMEFISAETRRASDSHPFHFRVQIRPKEESLASEFCDALSRYGMALESTSPSLATLSVNLAFPQGVQRKLATELDQTSDAGEPLVSLLQWVVRAEQMELHAVLDAGEEPSLGARAACSEATPEFVALLANVLQIPATTDGFELTGISNVLGLALPAQTLKLFHDDQTVCILAARSIQMEASTGISRRENPGPRGIVFQATVDLNQWTDRKLESSATQLIEGLERLYHLARVRMKGRGVIDGVDSSRFFENFRSVASRVGTGSDAELRMTVRSAADGIIAEGTISEPLYRLLVARELIADGTVQKLLMNPRQTLRR